MYLSYISTKYFNQYSKDIHLQALSIQCWSKKNNCLMSFIRSSIILYCFQPLKLSYYKTYFNEKYFDETNIWGFRCYWWIISVIHAVLYGVSTDRFARNICVGCARLLRRWTALDARAVVALLAGQAPAHAPVEVVRALALTRHITTYYSSIKWCICVPFF